MRASILLICFAFTLFSLELTTEQKTFIEKHPIITVGIDPKWEGFDAVDINGRHTGIASDYLKVISQMTGLKFDYIAFESYENATLMMKEKKVDLLPAIFYTPERADFMYFTDPFLSVPFYIFSKEENHDDNSLEKLKGLKVAVPEGYMITEWLKNHYPSINVVESFSIYDGLEMVYKNEASAFINDYPSTRLVLEYSFLPGIGVVAPIPQLSHAQLHMAVNKDMKTLKDIINLVNANMPEKTVEYIRKKWLLESKISMLNFSRTEREWLSNHQKITFSMDPDWLPFEGYNEELSQYYGIANDVLQLISSRTGIKFTQIAAKSWNKAKENVIEGKAQLLPVVMPSNKLNKYFYFSNPYLKIPYVVFGNVSHLGIDEYEDLRGKKVAILKRSKVYEYIQKNYPKIVIVPVDESDDLLRKYESKEAEFFIDNLASASYALNTSNINDVVGLLELEMFYTPSIGLSKELGTTGLAIINKAIGSIGEEEMRKAYDKWIFIRSVNEKSADNKLFYGVTALGLIAFLLLVWWMRKIIYRREKKE